ncbi:MAG: hypothetical protein JWQ06_1859 [Mucilaginibacter sp.]|nr:hypothetical protein [Mucilaginibacter sp.]
MLNHDMSEIRSIIIDHAVKVEFLINGVLSRALGLYESSISFGNSSTALSFISKVILLLDLKILKEEEVKKLRTFSEIRNKFAHSFMIMELKDCPQDILNKLKIWYDPKTDVKKIKDFNPLYNNLYADVKKAIENILEVIIEKGGKKGEELSSLRYNDILFEQVQEYSKNDADFKNKFIEIINKTNKIFDDNPPSDDSLNSLPIL